VKKGKKEVVRKFGIVGLFLGIVCFVFAYLMGFIRCTPPLNYIYSTIFIGILGIELCIVQIVKNSSKIWSILSVVGIICAIIGIYGSMALAVHPC